MHLSTFVLALALSIPLRAQIIERVLVKVNGDIFTQTELEDGRPRRFAPGWASISSRTWSTTTKS